MRYFGLDVHKSYCEGAELLPDNTIRRFRFPNDKKEWKRFAKGLDGNCKVALEATSNTSVIYDILSERGVQVFVVNRPCQDPVGNYILHKDFPLKRPQRSKS
ncbi:MAG TPA: hypothetical protein DCE07_00435 [Peptococcaceae bacterium]|nr:hypothetical protein [Peptococcaceae bacterium]